MKNLIVSVMLASAALGLNACDTAPKTEEAKATQTTDVNGTIAQFKAKDPSLANLFNTAQGYAVFPTVGKGGLVVGGAYGRGQLFEQGKMIGYVDLSQATIGAQIGGQSYSEIIFFENAQVLDSFKKGQFEFAAQASAVAVASGAGANAKYTNGVMVFTLGEKGLMAEASVGGQKFDYQPK
jgi:lipid-binding SYLF domain-containing protein